MGAQDKNRELRDIADLLEHIRRKRFTFSEYGDIFEAVRSKLESVQEDVEESADNLEERFESRAEELRDKYEWVEGAMGVAEEAAGSFTEEDIEGESFDETAERAEGIVEELEGTIEETPGPHKTLPAIGQLVTFTPQGEKKVAKEKPLVADGKAVWEKVFIHRGGNYTDRNLRDALREGIITEEEFDSALTYIFSLLDKASSLDEWRRYLGRDLIEYDIKLFVIWGYMTGEQATKWREALKPSRPMRY